MTYYDYIVGMEISAEEYPFYALIQTAMRQADTDNKEKLKKEWPEVWKDLIARYNAPGGLLKGER